MRTNDDYTLLEVLDQYVLAGATNEEGTESTLYNLNGTAAYLWRNLQDSDFTVADMATLLVEEYGISESDAQADASDILTQWADAGLCV